MSGQGHNLFILPMMVVMVLFFLSPLVLLGIVSVTGPDGSLSLENYRVFLSDGFAVGVLVNTIALGAKVVAAVTMLGLPIALLYWHAGPRLRTLILIATLLPMLTSNVVRTFAWIVILGRNGPISQGMVELGLSPRPFSLLHTETGLIMALTQIELPLLVLPMIAVLATADRRLIDASEVLGAGRWRSFFTVLLPMLLPAIFAGWVLVFASATTSYVTHSVIGGARLIYMPQFVYREVGILFQWPMAAAISFLLLVSTGVVMIGLTLLARHSMLANG
jgi:putative spermidine/putrescine transport system permease protein